uniref:HEAT repeat domain-containing protein n=1 Tax=Trichloromonas sp. TaxID=3069249 RepID=UPI003D81B38A
GLSRNPQVVKKLAELIDKGGFSAPELELRLAAIGALADIGSSAALPALEQLLKGKSLLNTGALNRLKAEALRSLEKYPAAATAPLLDRLGQSTRGEMSAQVAEMRRKMQGVAP